MLRAALAALALAALPLSAWAQQAITCTASNITLNFGTYDVLSGAPHDAAGSFTVSCVSTVAQDRTVTYSAGLAVAPVRQLAPPAGADRLAYDVYVDPARTQPWGDANSGTFLITGSLFVPRKASATDAPKNFYARIAPGGQDVSAASPGPPPTPYAQTITVTVTCTPSPPC